ncbi:phosphoenolpyruvate-protein phosphotransferase [Alkalihalobacillus alcalophilus ATCC 27647 = CGMCC 1.3604]|uniref:Phosphoenolpyruvate-protein phosphotransferase n=1 Tax=Alkalihalobacillus alcalophilus ATCC 27647 = CGMCC 1.3604 TaxID=1218173 RepID=A0A094WMP0_ALKAL|nr:phosphoenolpyruvate--protein phosphotransferase [Alkalihalobacillus alcalophilus]KGA98131.1 phosphoenolpyruvate-protein phosphotransferase [Alkalihalobacillus alcalophilus ATCC 27647 = CGMCC 1.3604]MED1563545.1 phosphoenolpyruvate--protein phosphotransferase [Alkalihalobacillus alcalophilus]THG89027.1 phosphoenolpyruvate-protein phosphotransferase [Alkalihalobacillus alcalophilus ATCC 27647 = CGMCC 1.3604]
MSSSTVLQGVAAAQGVAIAKAFLHEEPTFDIVASKVESVEDEVQRFDEALAISKQELSKIKDETEEKMGADKAEIFAAHLLVLADPELVDAVKDKIRTEQYNAGFALNEVATMFITMFENMDNEYMKERAADIYDVKTRVLSHLFGFEATSLATITEETIVIAHDLTPSDTAQINPEYVKGFATNIGGRTSHSAIMSRSLEIPAVVGTKKITEQIENGMTIIVDGLDGTVILNPTAQEIKQYEEKRASFLKEKEEWKKLVNEKTLTSDGAHVELAANIGTTNDLEGVIKNGAEGVGLFRTEFLYMGRDELPSEEEQYEAYKTVLEKMEGKPVVIRTLDIGGDKELPYLDLPEEMNPFLGLRAVRLCLEMPDMFRVQLRALLRASSFGNLKIMFPMIAAMEELRQAKVILQEEKDKLITEGIEVSDSIEIGIMVEIPSTAAAADRFVKEVDFFSIGTNDLIQYTLAADRMNERVSYLYQPYHPAIIRLIKNVIDVAHQEGKWVGMCGEMAGDEVAIPILLGLGLDEFSMSATSILPARNQLLQLSKQETAEWVTSLLAFDTSEEIEQEVRTRFLP